MTALCLQIIPEKNNFSIIDFTCNIYFKCRVNFSKSLLYLYNPKGFKFFLQCTFLLSCLLEPWKIIRRTREQFREQDHPFPKPVIFHCSRTMYVVVLKDQSNLVELLLYQTRQYFYGIKRVIVNPSNCIVHDQIQGNISCYILVLFYIIFNLRLHA